MYTYMHMHTCNVPYYSVFLVHLLAHGLHLELQIRKSAYSIVYYAIVL